MNDAGVKKKRVKVLTVKWLKFHLKSLYYDRGHETTPMRFGLPGKHCQKSGTLLFLALNVNLVQPYRKMRDGHSVYWIKNVPTSIP